MRNEEKKEVDPKARKQMGPVRAKKQAFTGVFLSMKAEQFERGKKDRAKKAKLAKGKPQLQEQ